MATIHGTTTTDFWTFKLEVAEGTPNVANNTSPVTVDVYIGRHTVESYMYAPYINCTVSCTGVSNKSFVFSTSSRIDIATGAYYKIGSVTFSAVPHNADGTKTVTIGASFTNTIKPSSGSASGSVTLTTIARASQPSLVTWPENTQNVGYFGDTIAIHMNRKSSNFTHKVRYEFGSQSGVCIDAETGKEATAIENGFTWTIPTSLMNLIPASTQGSGRVYVDTYNGSTLIGTKYSGFTAKVPDNVKPSIDYTWKDTTGFYSTYGKLVVGLSIVEITGIATPAYSSPIASYKITVEALGTTYNSSTATFVFSIPETRIIVSATDKRGRTNSLNLGFGAIPYSAPQISALSAKRCNADGTPNDTGAYLQPVFSATVTALNNKNVATYILSYKKTSASSWTDVNLTALNNNYSVNNYKTSPIAADINSSYDVKITIHDRHSTTAETTKGSTGFVLMNFHESGKAVGIGKVAEDGNSLDIALPTIFRDKVIINDGEINVDLIYPVGSIYLAYNHTSPASLFGGTWTRIEQRFLWASGATATIGGTGGSQTHTLTQNEMPYHEHFITEGGMTQLVYTSTKEMSGSGDNYISRLSVYGRSWNDDADIDYRLRAQATGGGAAHNNMPPYIQISVWRRTA